MDPMQKIGCKPWNDRHRRTRDQKIVVMDGPDRVGKSTIGYALSRDLQVPYFRMTSQHANWRAGRFKEALEFDQPYLLEMVRQMRLDLVIDRAWPSEWVYSRVFGRETNPEVLRRVDEGFAQLGAYIVIPLRRDYTKCSKDELVGQDKLEKLHDTYQEFSVWTRCSTVTIYVDDFDNDLSQQVPRITQEFRWGEELLWARDAIIERVRRIKPLELLDEKEFAELLERELKRIP